MNFLLLGSQIALWLIVLLLIVCIGALTRQVALLHRRIGQTGARMESSGPAIGELVPVWDAPDIFGRRMSIGRRDRPILLLFISRSCVACKDLLPAARSMARSEKHWLDLCIVDVSEPDAEAARAFAMKNGIDFIPYIVSAAWVKEWRVLAPPYAVLVERDGRVHAKGVANHLEHLESLLNALAVGHASLEGFIAATEAARANREGQAATSR